MWTRPLSGATDMSGTDIACTYNYSHYIYCWCEPNLLHEQNTDGSGGDPSHKGYNVDWSDITCQALNRKIWTVTLNALCPECVRCWYNVAVNWATHRGHRRANLGGDSSPGPSSLSPLACVCWLAAPLGTWAVRTLKRHNTQCCINVILYTHLPHCETD